MMKKLFLATVMVVIGFVAGDVKAAAVLDAQDTHILQSFKNWIDANAKVIDANKLIPLLQFAKVPAFFYGTKAAKVGFATAKSKQMELSPDVISKFEKTAKLLSYDYEVALKQVEDLSKQLLPPAVVDKFNDLVGDLTQASNINGIMGALREKTNAFLAAQAADRRARLAQAGPPGGPAVPAAAAALAAVERAFDEA